MTERRRRRASTVSGSKSTGAVAPRFRDVTEALRFFFRVHQVAGLPGYDIVSATDVGTSFGAMPDYERIALWVAELSLRAQWLLGELFGPAGFERSSSRDLRRVNKAAHLKFPDVSSEALQHMKSQSLAILEKRLKESGMVPRASRRARSKVRKKPPNPRRRGPRL
jgi:hypothetical protein